MFVRFYHVSNVCRATKKQANTLYKMVNPSSKKKWYPSTMPEDALPTVKSLMKSEHVPGKQARRRLSMLNKTFMKQITDLMSTGTVALDIVGRGLEISKVNVSSNFQTVNVFWVCKGSSEDEETEKLLSKVAGILRHELSTLRVMGVVPYIVFCKDKQESQVAELDRRLSYADYGPDYTPTDMGHLLKTEFTSQTKLSPEMKAKIQLLEQESIMDEESIPEMTHSVYGLDHAKIMSRLLAARKRSKDAWANMRENPSVISYTSRDTITSQDGISSREIEISKQQEELAEFLQKRRILQSKIQRDLRSDKGLQLNLLGGNDETSNDEYYEDDDDWEDDEFLDAEDTSAFEIKQENYKSDS